MTQRRLQKFILSFGIILALLTSSLAACACSHHMVIKAEGHMSSCHQTSHKTQHNEAVESKTENKSPAFSVNCNCFVKTVQPVVVFKSENVKTQKVLAVLPAQIEAENHEPVFENETAKVHFKYHFYNSNYLKKLTPPRAPPVL